MAYDISQSTEARALAKKSNPGKPAVAKKKGLPIRAPLRKGRGSAAENQAAATAEKSAVISVAAPKANAEPSKLNAEEAEQSARQVRQLLSAQSLSISNPQDRGILQLGG